MALQAPQVPVVDMAAAISAAQARATQGTTGAWQDLERLAALGRAPQPANYASMAGYGETPADSLAMLRQFEGFRETPYWDVNAYRVGYGSDTITRADGTVVPVAKGMAVTREDAERDLARRVNSEFVPGIISAIGQKAWDGLNPQQRGSLTSIAYNYGSLPKPVVGAVMTPGYDDDVAAIRGLSSHNNGINAKRRNREADFYYNSLMTYGG